ACSAAAADFLTSLAGEIDLEFDGTNTNAYLFTDDGTNLIGGKAWTLKDDTAGAGGDMIILPGALTWNAEEKDSDYDVAIDAIDWGAIFRFNTDDEDELTWTYPEEEAIHKVYVSEVLTNIPELGTGGGVPGASVAVLDTELSDVKDMNVIAIGGSGINRATAELLGVKFPTYGSQYDWQKATKVDGPGKAIIKLMNSPWTTGKTAMLVAGWEGVDTQRAAKALREDTLKTQLAGKTSALLNTATSTVSLIEA
ncbi:MAG: hypothetical protein N3G19_02610, partial [Candidatus Pacearchaeota archaeon]|nr:hypothetical protein [Candidatus Pacearchaeota archaeon]